MIEPLEVEIDPYSVVRRIKDFCYLRREERTFLLGKVAGVITADTELSIISEDSL